MTADSSSIRAGRGVGWGQHRFSSIRAIAVIIAVGVATFALSRRHLIDDSYITLSYARNLAETGEWTLVAGLSANSATSPLNVMLLAGLTMITGNAVTACGLLFVAACAGLYLSMVRLMPSGPALLATVAVVANPLTVSTVGMEVMLSAVTLAALAGIRDSAVAAGLFCGVIAIIRLDLVIIAAIIVCGQTWRERSVKRVLIIATTAAGVAAPWYVWSWLQFGSLLPDTLVLKTAERSWSGGWTFLSGPAFYLWHQPMATIGAFMLPLIAVIVFIRRRNLTRVGVWFFGALIYSGVYCLLGVPPYHWYYAPFVVAATVYLIATVSVRMAFWITVIAVTMSVVSYVASGWDRQIAPISSNHATSGEYQRISADIRRLAPGSAIATAGEIGTLAYYCRCMVIDDFSDRSRIAQELRDRRNRPSPIRNVWRLNYQHLDAALNAAPASPPARYRLIWSTTSTPEAVRSWPATSPTRGRGFLLLYAIPA